MENVQKNHPLETEPLSRLLLRYSVPTTLTLMVNYLYSIVDQIFVGQGVGITGMAAVNVAFPMSILVNAVSLLLGDGCAATSACVWGERSRRRQTASWAMPSPGSLPAACCWQWSAASLHRRS